jgi:putative transcriptional regulator
MIKLTLDKVLKQAGVTRYYLSKQTGIMYHVIDKYYKNKVVRYDGYILERICLALDCGIEDIIEIKKD